MRAWAIAAGVQRSVAQRHEPSRTQRRSVAGETPSLAGDVGERQPLRDEKSGGTAVVAPPHAGNAARCLGRRRSS